VASSNPRTSARASSAPSRAGRLGALAALLVVLVGGGLWFFARGEAGPIREIDNRELARLVEAGVKVVDIREPWEWEETGVVEGSHLITAFDAQGRIRPDFAARLQEAVSPDEEMVLICRTGNRSGVLAPALAEQLGYGKIRNVTRGILPWIQGGGRVVQVR
jgi:rhodanese-related sulfurtransferase